MIVHTLRLRLANAYLLETDRGALLIDTGGPGGSSAICKALNQLGWVKLDLIFLTHAHLDHYGSAAAIREMTGAQIAIHPADEAALVAGRTPLGEARGFGRWIQRVMPLLKLFLAPPPTPADILLEEGSTLSDWGSDLQVQHTPGHTPGSCTLVVQGRLAFAGDLISTTGKPHAQRFFAHDWEALDASVQWLTSQSFEAIYPGHGPEPISSDMLRSALME